MTTFADAFAAEQAALKEACRLADLEYRWNTRYRLWRFPDDPDISARAARLGARQRAAREAHEDAAAVLADLWHRLSLLLDPGALEYRARLASWRRDASLHEAVQ